MTRARRVGIDPEGKYYTTNWLTFMAINTNTLNKFKAFFAHHTRYTYKKWQQN